MAEKYEDLYEPIINDETFYMTVFEGLGARIALQWLDEHPDQVPGRTITESGWIEACKATMGGDMVAPFALATRLGITVVPDPEPTNAEKLEKALTDYALQHGGMRGGVDEIAAHLDKAGVKAPGGDDDL